MERGIGRPQDFGLGKVIFPKPDLAGHSFATFDLYFAAALLAEGNPLADSGQVNGDSSRGPKTVFYFDGDAQHFETRKREFHSGRFLVNALAYREKLRQLQDIIHAK